MNKANGGYHILDMSSFPAITLTGAELEDKAINEIKEAFDEFDKPVVIHGLKYKDEENYIHIMPDSFVDRSEWLDGDSYVMPLYIKIASDSVSQMVVTVAKAAKTISYAIVEAQTGGGSTEGCVIASNTYTTFSVDPSTLRSVQTSGLKATFATGETTAPLKWLEFEGEETTIIPDNAWIRSEDNGLAYVVTTKLGILDEDILNTPLSFTNLSLSESYMCTAFSVEHKLSHTVYTVTLTKNYQTHEITGTVTKTTST